jgi:AcrR family transcriptional regulator
VRRKPREEARRARNDVYRQHIFEAAERVFAERGYEQTKVQEISKLAGLSMGTIYAIFPGKAELYRAILRSARRSCWRWRRAWRAAVPPPARPSRV